MLLNRVSIKPTSRTRSYRYIIVTDVCPGGTRTLSELKEGKNRGKEKGGAEKSIVFYHRLLVPVLNGTRVEAGLR